MKLYILYNIEDETVVKAFRKKKQFNAFMHHFGYKEIAEWDGITDLVYGYFLKDDDYDWKNDIRWYSNVDVEKVVFATNKCSVLIGNENKNSKSIVLVLYKIEIQNGD